MLLSELLSEARPRDANDKSYGGKLKEGNKMTELTIWLPRP
jgi:hypothetical protein